jgi:hypothetical protein
MVDAVIDGYFPVLESLGELLEELEEEIMDRPDRDTLARLHAVRRVLMTLHRTMWRQRDALNQILRDEGEPLGEGMRVYFRDAHDHALQVLDAIESYREVTVGLMDVYLSSISHRLNEVMKTLTIMATIFIPLTFIAGVYGMNFDWMPELRWRWGYPWVPERQDEHHGREAQLLGDRRHRGDRGPRVGEGRAAVEAGLAVLRVRVTRAQVAGEEDVVGEQHAVEAGLLRRARDLDQLLGLRERNHLPELHDAACQNLMAHRLPQAPQASEPQ